MRTETVVREFEPASPVEFPSPSETGMPSSTPRLNLVEVLELLWERRSLVSRVAILALVLSTVIAFLIPKQFDSTVRIMPPDSLNNNSAMLAALAGKAPAGLAAVAGNLMGAKSSGALFVDLLRSRTVQDKLVDRFNLQKVYWESYKQDARRTLDGRTQVSEDRKSGVITLQVTDRDPHRASDLAQAYIEELDRLVSQVSTSSARRERMFIEQRLQAVKHDLESAEQEFSAFASKNTALDIKEQTKAMVESAAMLQGQLITAESELQSLGQIYTRNNVRVRALRARVDELKRQLQKLGGTDASLVSDAAQPNELYPSIRKLPLLGVQWADLYRKMKIQETVYELLTQQYELARIQEAKEIPTVNVIDPANVPEKKSWPPRLLVIVLLSALTVILVMAWMMGTVYLQRLGDNDPRAQLASHLRQTVTRVIRRPSILRTLFSRSSGG